MKEITQCKITSNNNNSKERKDIKESIWQQLLKGWLDLSHTFSYDILNMILKSIQLMTVNCSDCIFQNFSQTWKVIQRCSKGLENEKATAKLTPSIIETCSTIFTQENTKQYEVILQEELQASLYVMLKQVFTC